MDIEIGDIDGAELAYRCHVCGEPFQVIMEDGHLVCTKDGLKPVQRGREVYHGSCEPPKPAA